MRGYRGVQTAGGRSPLYDLGSNDRHDRCDLEANAGSPFEGQSDRLSEHSYDGESADTALRLTQARESLNSAKH